MVSEERWRVLRHVLLLVLALTAVLFTLAVRGSQTNEEVVLKGNTQTDPTPTRESELQLRRKLSGSEPLPIVQPNRQPLPRSQSQVQVHSLQASTEVVHLTFYACLGPNSGYCDQMRNGEKVHDGAAACDPTFLTLGTSFKIRKDPKIYTCEDTGGGITGNHVDLWFKNEEDGWAYLQKYGTEVTIEVLR